jgi:YgiT-type zinc finger domain-containing protein
MFIFILQSCGGCESFFREGSKIRGKWRKAMKKEELAKKWRGESEEIISGMTEWREQHPKAKLVEIEAEVDRRLAGMRAQMIADAALASQSVTWESGAEALTCPACGQALEKKGKKKRKLQTRGGKEIELEREYGICPQCGQGIFPPG